MPLPRYDTSRSYDWNYRHPPAPPQAVATPVPGKWTFCGQRVNSPLGIAAGPLLNGDWCMYYAALGFDVVTYKTVRSGERSCYQAPNLTPVVATKLVGGETDLPVAPAFDGSWAISFGMPSKPVDDWTADLSGTRALLPSDKKLAVSVVGTFQPDWSIEQLADDYANCARLAAEHGADAVEINLSCPNVTTCDGQLYQNPAQASLIAKQTRAAMGPLPLVAKIGFDTGPTLLALLDALVGEVDAVATTNCIAATVAGQFDGQPRGIGGKAILDSSVRQVERIGNWIAQNNAPLKVIGVGGISTAGDVRRYLDAGAEHTQLATAVMQDPEVGLKIRADLAEDSG